MAGELEAATGIANLIPYAGPVLQAVGGVVQAISGNKRAKQLKKQLKPYQTPAELVKILNATQAQMSDTSYSDFATEQVGRTTSQNLGAAMRLGANPNQLSATFNEGINGMLRIGQEQHQINMANFGRFLDSLKVMADSKDAERVSKNNLIKDELQQAATDKAQGVQNVGNAINSAIGIYAAQKTGDLFKDKTGGSSNQIGNTTSVESSDGSMSYVAPVPNTVQGALQERTIAATTPFGTGVNNTSTYADFMRRLLGQ